MPCLIPETQSAEVRAALQAMLPPHVMDELLRRGDVLRLLDRAATEDEKAEIFDTALIEQGGTHIWPQSGPRPGNHEHEISMLGAYGNGPTYAAAIARWCKAAQRIAGDAGEVAA